MRRFKIQILAVLTCLATAASAQTAPFPDALYNTIQQLADSELRSEKYRARNHYRHPAETLRFFDVRDDMTVVEIWPGGGWYTEILAPYLKQNGKLYAAGFDPESTVPFFSKNALKLQEKLAANPDLFEKVELTVLQPPKKLEIAPPESADRVLTFRNVHNWTQAGAIEAVFEAMYRALKPGGILGVVEHRGNQFTNDRSGYVRESRVIALAKNAGFRLVGKSEINANPKDFKNHPKGVWTLPPTLRLGDERKEHYLSIGESDRMTLKFVKPGD